MTYRSSVAREIASMTGIDEPTARRAVDTRGADVDLDEKDDREPASARAA